MVYVLRQLVNEQTNVIQGTLKVMTSTGPVTHVKSEWDKNSSTQQLKYENSGLLGTSTLFFYGPY